MKKYIIYEISCLDKNITDVYIGSTQNFRSRKYQHKNYCNNENNKEHNFHIYNIIRENGGWENWNMHPIEEVECETIIQAHIREQYWVQLKQSTLNSYNAFISAEGIKQQQKEYRDANADKYKQQQKEYRDANKDKLNQYKREKWAENKQQKATKSIM